MAENTDWNTNLGAGFGTYQPRDEFYHGTGEPADSLTETWFWNFHVAGAAINCFAYCWVHPTLGIVTSGLYIYQGMKPNHLACEVFDVRNYMSRALIGDGNDIVIPNGLRVRVMEPLTHLHLSFADPARDSRADIDLRAMAPPIMRANNKHFEQVMHATGTLVLRGTEYVVDCYPVRDRSWGEKRPEDHAPMPPYTWVTGTFGADFAFNVGSHDDPARDPDWLDKMPAPGRIFNDGWVQIVGETRRITRAAKLTTREMPTCRPLAHDYEFEDSAGEIYRMRGEIVAQTDWSGWSNIICHTGLVRWSWNGRTGWGDSQEVQWNDYVWKMNRRDGDIDPKG